MCILYGSQNKQRHLPHTTVSEWLVIIEKDCVYCAVRFGPLMKYCIMFYPSRVNSAMAQEHCMILLHLLATYRQRGAVYAGYITCTNCIPLWLYLPVHVSNKSLTVDNGILSLRHGVAPHINIQQTVHCLFVCLFFVTIVIVSETYEFVDPSYSKRA